MLGPLTVHKSDSIRGSAHYQLAQTYFQENHFAAALKHIEAAGASDPAVMTDGAPLFFKARVYEKLGQRQDAIAAYREALAGGRDAQDVLVPLIRLELAERQTANALDHLRRFTLAVGDDPAGMIQAAELHLQMNRLDDAFDLATRARAAGLVVDSQRVLGLVHLRKKEWVRAVFHLERTDADAEVLDGLLQACLLLGEWAKVERHGQTAQGLDEEKVTTDLRKTLHRLEALERERDRISKEMRVSDGNKEQAAKVLGRFLCGGVRLRATPPPATRRPRWSRAASRRAWILDRRSHSADCSPWKKATCGPQRPTPKRRSSTNP